MAAQGIVILSGVVGVGVGVVGVGVTTFVPRQNLRTAIGIDLLFFLNDWYE